MSSSIGAPSSMVLPDRSASFRNSYSPPTFRFVGRPVASHRWRVDGGLMPSRPSRDGMFWFFRLPQAAMGLLLGYARLTLIFACPSGTMANKHPQAPVSAFN
jgi:hypothetical protein